MASISPTDVQVNGALVSFLTKVLPSGATLIKGQVNRTPEPLNTNYVVYWPLRRPRLSTNVDTSKDVSFMGSIAAAVGPALSVMTVDTILIGTILLGSDLFGVGVTTNTKIVAQLSGTTGGVGTYSVSIAQVVTESKMAAGARTQMQATEVVIQLDVHGPLGPDWATIISTLFRDTFGVQFFNDTGLPIAPLYVEDPRQIPFISGETQYEDRWVVVLVMQVNWTVLVPQQYADVLEVGLLNVETEFPS